jgi:hypothetical protein
MSRGWGVLRFEVDFMFGYLTGNRILHQEFVLYISRQHNVGFEDVLSSDSLLSSVVFGL